jgi:hypothetical protein
MCIPLVPLIAMASAAGLGLYSELTEERQRRPSSRPEGAFGPPKAPAIYSTMTPIAAAPGRLERTRAEPMRLPEAAAAVSTRAAPRPPRRSGGAMRVQLTNPLATPVGIAPVHTLGNPSGQPGGIWLTGVNSVRKLIPYGESYPETCRKDPEWCGGTHDSDGNPRYWAIGL